ncbi:hypothetical protein ACKAV7_003436 [Fusarium commune]
MNDQTALYGNKFAELVAQGVSNPLPAENAVNAKLTSIDRHWDCRSGQQTMVNSTEDITDFATSSGAPNWNTCWGVDSNLTDVFFAGTHEYVKSDALKVNGIMDTPSVFIGKIPKPWDRDSYQDAPDDLVDMKELATGPGTSRAYFSDYLVKKKFDGGGHRIYARFDLSLTWNAGEGDKKNFELSSLNSTATNEFLNCHRAALQHKTRPLKEGSVSKQPYLDFLNSIVT